MNGLYSDTNFFHTSTLFAGGGYERLKPGMRPPVEGALVPLYLAADPAAGGINGAFYVRQGRDGRRAVSLGWAGRGGGIVGAEPGCRATVADARGQRSLRSGAPHTRR